LLASPTGALLDRHSQGGIFGNPLENSTPFGNTYIRVKGAEKTFVDASQGGSDVAYLDPAPGDQLQSVDPSAFTLTGPTYFISGTGCERFQVISAAGA